MTSNGNWWAKSNYMLKENSIENESLLANITKIYKIKEYDSFLNTNWKTNKESGFSYEK